MKFPSKRDVQVASQHTIDNLLETLNQDRHAYLVFLMLNLLENDLPAQQINVRRLLLYAHAHNYLYSQNSSCK